LARIEEEGEVVMVLGVGEGEGLRRQISSASENLKNLRFIWLIDLREYLRGVGFLGRFYETRRRGRYMELFGYFDLSIQN
jgi:hypothetical protein